MTTTSVKMTTNTTTRLTRDSFDRFGDDLAELLLSSMKITTKDNLRLQLVSKQWQRLIFNGQTVIEFDRNFCNYIQTDHMFELIIKKCPNIQRLVLINLYPNDKLVDLLLNNCQLSLRHLCLYANSIDVYSFDRLLAGFGRQLLTLELPVIAYNHREVVDKVAKYLTQIKRLVIGRNVFIELIDFGHYFTDDSGSDGCLLPTSLQSMSFQLTTKSQSLFGPFVAAYANRLTALDIVIDFDDQTVVPVFVSSLSLLSQLRQLRLTVQKFCTDIIVNLLTNGFSRQCRRIKSFSFTSSNQSISNCLFNQLMDSFGKDLKQLKRLAISCPVVSKCDEKPIITSESLKQMKQLTHLSFNLNGCIIGDQFFRDIDCHLPRLQNIHIMFADITRLSLQSMSRLRHLNTVRLADCRNNFIADYLVIGDLILAQPNLANVYISYYKYIYKFARGNYD